MPYKETVSEITILYNGKEYPGTMIQRKGIHYHTARTGETILAELVTITDGGKKLGVSECVTPARDCTEDERAAGRKLIQETAARIMTEQGLW